MTKILQINITANWGSHGKIAEGIGNVALSHGWESHIAYGRWFNPSTSILYHIGNMLDEKVHGLFSRIFDIHGLLSRHATRKLIHYIKEINPDIIHLHNIHGYYLNYPILFKYLTDSKKPVVWTLHDCWAFTGHCAHYMYINCEKWKSHCAKCPQKETYPKSIFFDNSYKNFELKKKYFLMPENLVLVPVSKWLENDVKQSFLRNHKIMQIYNGIDTNIFSPSKNSNSVYKNYNIPKEQKIILGVASNWFRKGFEDYLELANLIEDDFTIILVGLNQKELEAIPRNIIGLRRTNNLNDLIELYSAATVFFNPTWEDNFPTTILESLACGTPVVTYDTGGSAEAIKPETGFSIKKGDIYSAWEKITVISNKGKDYYKDKCRRIVVENFNKEDRFNDYFNLYCKMTKK